MKILKKPEVSSSVGLVLGAAGVIVGLVGVLGVVYGNFFQEHQTLVLTISVIVGFLAIIIMIGAMWHFVGPLKDNFTKPWFSKRFICRFLEHSKFRKYLLLITGLGAIALILLTFSGFSRIIDMMLAFATFVGGLAAVGYFWDKYQHVLSGWVEKCCKKDEILLLTLQRNSDFVTELVKRLEWNNIYCNFIDYTGEPTEIREDLLKKCQSHKVITVLYGKFETEDWLKQQLKKCQQSPLSNKIVVCNVTGRPLSENQTGPFSGEIIDNCSIEQLEQLLLELVKK